MRVRWFARGGGVIFPTLFSLTWHRGVVWYSSARRENQTEIGLKERCFSPVTSTKLHLRDVVRWTGTTGEKSVFARHRGRPTVSESPPYPGDSYDGGTGPHNVFPPRVGPSVTVKTNNNVWTSFLSRLRSRGVSRSRWVSRTGVLQGYCVSSVLGRAWGTGNVKKGVGSQSFFLHKDVTGSFV